MTIRRGDYVQWVTNGPTHHAGFLGKEYLVRDVNEDESKALIVGTVVSHSPDIDERIEEWVPLADLQRVSPPP